MLSRVVSVLFCGLLLLSAVVVWRFLDHPVSSFVIDGELTQAQQQTIMKVLSQASYAGVLSTPLDDVAATVEALSWTRQVSVRRAWPDGFKISLYHEKPVARWGEDEYLSASGRPLQLPDNYIGLPQLSVDIASPQRAMEVYRMLDQIAGRANLSISRLRQDEYAEWTLEFENGPIVVLGGEQLNERMHRFLLVQRRVLAGSDAPASYIDARYSSGVAVRYVQQPDANAELEPEIARDSGALDPMLAGVGIDTTGERP